MKTKILSIFALLMLVASILPAIAYIPPPPPPGPEFAIKINDTWTWITSDGWYNFTGIVYCTNFNVDVWVLNVIDLAGYDFKVSWDNTFFSLKNYTVIKLWNKEYDLLPAATYDKSTPYKQAAVAYDSPSFTGSAKVATLVFHIDNDVQYNQWKPTNTKNPFVFDLGTAMVDTHMSNNCTDSITHTNEGGFVGLIPKKPSICFSELSAGNITKSKVMDTFTLTVVISDIVRIKDVEIVVHYDPEQQNTTLQDIVIYEDLLPKPWATYGLQLNPLLGTVSLQIAIFGGWPSSPKPQMNGTGRIMSITFKAADDWMHTYPDYTFNATDHTWKVEKCSNLITKTGQISTCCPQGYDLIYLNDAVQITNTPMNFTFAPIPGDLDFSGHVDLVDLAMIASKFGTNYPPYDFNNSGGLVDIFDVVVVAKYYCRVVP